MMRRSPTIQQFAWLALLVTAQIDLALGHNVIYAINAGGDAHQGSDGIHYDRDPNKVGTASDFGKQLLMIGRASQNDEILYQTERYHTNTFGYDIPVAGDGDYVLLLKFCEVYFNAANMKVFDIVLNGDHTVVSDLDIFQQVGRGTAHDELIEFSISRNRLYYKEEESEIRGGKIRVEFIKGYRDNPKINAIVLIKGSIDSVARLPPLASAETDTVEPPVQQPQFDQFVQNEDEEPSQQQTPKQPRQHIPSGPKQPNPYSLDESSMLPIFIAIGAFIPLLFCLCKL
jgi:Malectin domain